MTIVCHINVVLYRLEAYVMLIVNTCCVVLRLPCVYDSRVV